MAITIKSAQDIAILQTGGRKLARIVDDACAYVTAGMTTMDIELFIRDLFAQSGGEPAFLGYRPEGVARTFPAAACISVNEEIVHGIPGSRVIQPGDVVTIDCGMRYHNLFTDHAVTIIIEPKGSEAIQLVNTTAESLSVGLSCVRAGAHVGDIGYAIESFVAKRYGIVRELAGHGVGYSVHEDPYIPNYGKRGEGTMLRSGMVLAIEPMLTIGSADVKFHDDQYTVSTRSKKLSAHFEHTVAVTEDGCVLLTALE